MTRKRKVHPLRIVLVILIIIVLIAIIFFAANLVFKRVTNEEPVKQEEVKEDDKTNDNDEVNVAINDYVVYIDDDNALGFNFIIADLTFKSSTGTINYDINNLTTAERVRLGNISSYEEKMISCGYDLKKLSYSTEPIVSESDTKNSSLFIPYTNIKGELCVYNGEVLKFDLDKNNRKASELKLSDDVQKTVVESDNYKLTILDAYVEDMMFVNGEEYEYPQTVDVYAFMINVEDTKNKTLIVEKAKYVPENSSVEIPAMGKEYKSVVNDNIIGKELRKGDQYSLFFSITNPTNDKATFGGKVYIKFENDSNWLEISTKHE